MSEVDTQLAAIGEKTLSSGEVKTTSRATVRTAVLRIQNSEGHGNRATVQTERGKHYELTAPEEKQDHKTYLQQKNCFVFYSTNGPSLGFKTV